MFVRKTLLFLVAICLAASTLSAQTSKITCPSSGGLTGRATITASIAGIGNMRVEVCDDAR